MRIGLGATVLAKGLAHRQLDGIGYYTQELAQRLSSTACDWTPMVFGQTSLSTIEQRLVYHLPRYSTAALCSALTTWNFAGYGQLHQKIDLFHATDHHIPRLKGIPVLATLMDAIPLAHPEWANARLRRVKNALWRKAARWADRVVTISNYSRGEIATHFGLDERLISVVPLGVDDRFFDRLSLAVLQQAKSEHGLIRPYFLCIGTLQPRKNIERVIDAYQRLPAALASSHDLVIVGRHGWGSDALVHRLRNMSSTSGVRWLGGVSDLRKRALLQGATALVFPSLSEGFGLPVLEAFASQTPVITSNTTSLPEVAADAALLIDPLDADAISSAMSDLAENLEMGNNLRRKGIERAQNFTWQACAAQTVALYKSMLGVTS
jgi:glycosyltransferase involved in cell wall biosynthesis